MVRLFHQCVMLEIMGIQVIEILISLGLGTMIMIVALFVMDGTFREWLVYTGVVRADANTYPFGEYLRKNSRSKM